MASHDVLDALRRSESYPGRPAVQERETHISLVFLAGERAYKLKKPLVLPFVDYGTPERRREMCREEVRLNRRLAPDVYLGVRGVVVDEAGRAQFVDDDDPSAQEYVVEMRRYDERRTLASLLARGELEADQIAALATRIATFHADAPKAPAVGPPVIAAERRFEQNVHELFARAEHGDQLSRILALERFALAFIRAHGSEFEARAARGCIRELHGDLRAEHVVFSDGIQIVDCVEFDRSLRELDVADDLAFLISDIEARGCKPLGERLLSAYRASGGDPGEDPLIAFYGAHRALVRAKVALVRGAQRPAPSGARRDGELDAERLIAIAESFAWRARLPLVIAVCGVPASGKSHLASALSRVSGLPHLSSDLTRKRSAGIDPVDRAPLDLYSQEFNQLTYRRLGIEAGDAVGECGGAIVDATFRRLGDRSAFRSSFSSAAPLTFLECRAPPAVLEARAAERDLRSDRISDAELAVVRRERTHWESLDEVDAVAHLLLRTDRPVSDLIGDLVALLDRRLAAVT